MGSTQAGALGNWNEWAHGFNATLVGIEDARRLRSGTTRQPVSRVGQSTA